MNIKIIYSIKKYRYILVLLILIIVFVVVLIISNNYTVIKAEEINGWSINRREKQYWITTREYGDNDIKCTKQQYYAYTNANHNVNTLNVVIYEDKPLMKDENKVISIMNFSVNWDKKIHKRTLPYRTYYRLVIENFINNISSNSIITRIYERYTPDGDQMKLVCENYVIPNFENINIAKKWLKDNGKGLTLKPRTIVTKEVLNKWKIEGYSAEEEYTELSPEGLTYEKLKGN